MKYIGRLALALACICLLAACNPQEQQKEYDTTATETGAQYQSSWVTGISKASAMQNAAVADWLALCATAERDGIGHYVLHNAKDNGDGTKTHHILLYRSATEKDCKNFTVDFAQNGDALTVIPTYTSSDKSQYGYDLIYLTLRADAALEITVDMLVDGDYPGAIQSTTSATITPDTFGTQTDE